MWSFAIGGLNTVLVCDILRLLCFVTYIVSYTTSWENQVQRFQILFLDEGLKEDLFNLTQYMMAMNGQMKGKLSKGKTRFPN